MRQNVIDVPVERLSVADGVDLSGATNARVETLAFADFIKETHDKTRSYPGYLEDGLLKALEILEEGLEINGDFVITALTGRIDKRLCDKGIGQYIVDTTKPDTLLIPRGKVTAVSTLAQKNDPCHFEPVVDIRVKSDTDKPTIHFTAPGQVEQRESGGYWYRFPLKKTVFAIYS